MRTTLARKSLLAAVVALSLPAAALAHDEGFRHEDGRQVRPPPPAPVSYERREVAELRQLVARLDAAADRRDGGRDAAWIEAELLRACDREIAEARAAQATGWREVPGTRRDLNAGWSRPARARLDDLLAVRAGLYEVRGRTGWRAVATARDLGARLVRLAALDVRYDSPPPPPAYGHGERYEHLEHGRG